MFYYYLLPTFKGYKVNLQKVVERKVRVLGNVVTVRHCIYGPDNIKQVEYAHLTDCYGGRHFMVKVDTYISKKLYYFRSKDNKYL
jgi:hypothetical protein